MSSGQLGDITAGGCFNDNDRVFSPYFQ